MHIQCLTMVKSLASGPPMKPQGQSFKPFYRNQRHLARPDSLSHIFLKLRQNHNLTKKALADKFGISEKKRLEKIDQQNEEHKKWYNPPPPNKKGIEF